jgi:hypothetical protein
LSRSLRASEESGFGRAEANGPAAMSVRTLFTLSALEWRLLLAATALVVVVRTALWILPSRFILSVTRRLATGAERQSRHDRPEPGKVAWAVEAASRRVPRASCLTQALATQLLLRTFGYGSHMRLGVGRSVAGDFLAHVWVEREGRVLIGGTGSLALTRLDLPRAAAGSSRADHS